MIDLPDWLLALVASGALIVYGVAGAWWQDRRRGRRIDDVISRRYQRPNHWRPGR